MITIKEIAKESGYSLGTVSRVLNNHPNVSDRARQRVMEVIREYDYHPNMNARHLKLQAQFGIALILKGSQNILLAEILAKVQNMIQECGYEAMVYYLDQDADEVAMAEQICRERTPFGIVFLGANIYDRKQRFAALRLPCVLITVDAKEMNLPNISSVAVDDVKSSEFVIDYLYRQGHREIGVIGANVERSTPARMRLKGCEKGFADHGLPFDRTRQYEYSRFSIEGGYSAASGLLEKYPEVTAIYAMSDGIAFGAMRALADNGKRVPEDISIVGYDGIEISLYSNPVLTTIRQNTEELAGRGVEILLDNIHSPGHPRWETVPFELQEGESVAPGPAGQRGFSYES